jgi:hypothetical protein
MPKGRARKVASDVAVSKMRHRRKRWNGLLLSSPPVNNMNQETMAEQRKKCYSMRIMICTRMTDISAVAPSSCGTAFIMASDMA